MFSRSFLRHYPHTGLFRKVRTPSVKKLWYTLPVLSAWMFQVGALFLLLGFSPRTLSNLKLSSWNFKLHSWMCGLWSLGDSDGCNYPMFPLLTTWMRSERMRHSCSSQTSSNLSIPVDRHVLKQDSSYSSSLSIRDLLKYSRRHG